MLKLDSVESDGRASENSLSKMQYVRFWVLMVSLLKFGKGWEVKYSHRKNNFVDATTGNSSLGKLYETALPLFAYIPALPTTYQN